MRSWRDRPRPTGTWPWSAGTEQSGEETLRSETAKIVRELQTKQSHAGRGPPIPPGLRRHTGHQPGQHDRLPTGLLDQRYPGRPQ